MTDSWIMDLFPGNDPPPEPKSVVVCGSRKWPAELAWYIEAMMLANCDDWRVIAGGAPGVDTFAMVYAIHRGWPRHEERADWEVKPDTPARNIRTRRDGTRYNVAAGFERNRRMLDMRPDLVLAFQADGSSGTQDTIDEARRRDIPVLVFTPPSQVSSQPG